MCTLVTRVEAGKFWVATNRDELFARPAIAPFWWPNEHFWAPRDEQAGGSWLGVTDRGMFVGVTNRFGATRDPSRRSRGELVIDALRFDSARSLHQHLSTLEAHRYNAFHLLYTDGTDTFVTWCDGEKITQDVLGDGLHVVTERSLGADDMGRTELVKSEVAKMPAWPKHEQLEAMMRIHNPEKPPAGTCVHIEAFHYGTRSSMVMIDGQVFWAEGRPCVNPYVERKDLEHR